MPLAAFSLCGELTELINQLGGSVNQQAVVLRVASDQVGINGAIMDAVTNPDWVGVTGIGQAVRGEATIQQG